MKTKQGAPTREGKAKTAVTPASSTGTSTAVNTDAGKEAAPPFEPAKHQQEPVAQQPPEPALGLLVTDTDVLLVDGLDSGELNTEPLTAQEGLDLRRCEIRVEEHFNAWLEMAAALSEIKAKRLYRENYKSFEEYCAKRWNMSRAHGNRYVTVHKIMKQLSPTGDTSIVAANERQVRELARVPEDKRANVLKKAKEKAGNGKMTSRHIKEAARELNGQHSADDVKSAPVTAETTKPIAANTIAPAESLRDERLLSLADLNDLAAKAYNALLNPSRHKEAEALLFKLKEHLRLYAEREVQRLGEAQLKQPAVAQAEPAAQRP